LSQYHLFHATRGELLTRLGRPDEAAAAFEAALRLTTNPAEQTLLHAKLDALRT
jgi:RNA polymerase sigma-70 factor (ECF subfamily)